MPFSDEDGALVRRDRPKKLARAAKAFTLGVFALVTAVSSGNVARAQISTWDQYQGGPEHSGDASGPSVPLKAAWPEPFTIEPGGPNDDYGLSSPVFSGDDVISVGPTAVYEVDSSTGSTVRSIPRSFGPSVTPAIADVDGKAVIVFTQGFAEGPGPPSTSATPSISSTTASPSPTGTPSGSGSAGVKAGESSTTPEMLAVDAKTGKAIWKSPVSLANVSRTGVTVEGSTAFVGDNSGTVYAVDVATGKVLWKRGLGGYLETAIAAEGSNVISTTQWNIGAHKGASVVAMDRVTGQVKWSHQDVAGGASAPVVDGGNVFVSFGDGSVVAFRGSDGAISWQRTVPFTALQFWSWMVPVVGEGVVAVADGRGRVDGFDERTGDSLWEFATNEDLQRGNPLFVDGDVVVGTSSGELMVVEARTGRLVFRTIASGGGYRGMAASGETLVVTKSGVRPGLVAFASDPSGTLISEASPTIFVPGKTLLAFAVAAIPIAVIVLLLGRPLMARIGPVEFEEDETTESAGGEPS